MIDSDREEFHSGELAFRPDRNAEEKLKVIPKIGMHRVVVDQVTRIVENQASPVPFNSLKDVRAVTMDHIDARVNQHVPEVNKFSGGFLAEIGPPVQGKDDQIRHGSNPSDDLLQVRTWLFRSDRNQVYSGRIRSGRILFIMVGPCEESDLYPADIQQYGSGSIRKKRAGPGIPDAAAVEGFPRFPEGFSPVIHDVVVGKAEQVYA